MTISAGCIPAVKKNDLYEAFTYDYADEVVASESTYLNCLLHARDQIIESYQSMLRNNEISVEEFKKMFSDKPTDMPDKRRYAYFCATIEDMFYKFDIDAPDWCKPHQDNVLDLSEMIIIGTRPFVASNDAEYDKNPTRKIFLSHGIRVADNHTSFM